MSIEIFYSILVSLCISGGLGYINYFILDRMGEINVIPDDKEEKNFFLMLFSLINLIIYFLINKIILNIYLSISITIILTILLLTPLYKKMSRLIYSLINYCRKKSNLGELSNKNIRQHLFDKNEVLFIYVYDLHSNDPIACGCMGWNEWDEKDFKEFELVPFSGEEKLEQISFKKAFSMAEDEKNKGASVYINLDKNIKIVIIPEVSSND